MVDISLTSTQASGFKKTDFDEIERALELASRTINVEALKVGSREIIDINGTLDPTDLRNTSITSTELETLRNGSDASLLHNHTTLYPTIGTLNAHTADTSIHFTKSSILLDDLGNVSVPSPTSGQSLIYNSTLSIWEAGTPPVGDITAVYATTPLTGGGTFGDVTIGIQQANSVQNGYLYSGDWVTFNSKTDNTAFLSHTTDSTIHFTKNSILLNDLGDVSAGTPSSSEALIFNGAEWVNNGEITFKTKDETINGKWAFNTSPTMPYPSLGIDATNKDYVDEFVQGLRYVEPVINFLSSPTTSPITGDRYIIATSPTSSWISNYNDIAEWKGSDWNFTLHTSGLATFVTDQESLYVYSEVTTSWVKFASVGQHNNLAGLQGGQSGEYYHLSQNEHDNLLFTNSSATISPTSVYTFNTSPIVPIPSLGYHAVSKDYVDGLVSSQTFLTLADTPSTYNGFGSDILKVSTSEDGIYFAEDYGTRALNELVAHTSSSAIHFLTSEIRLMDLSDVDVVTVQDNEVLTYNADISKWVPKPHAPEMHAETVSLWIDNGDGTWYADIIHNFNSEDVIVLTYDNVTKEEVMVDTIKKLNLNTIRVYITNNIDVLRVMVLKISNVPNFMITATNWTLLAPKKYYYDVHHGLNEKTIMIQAYDTSDKEVVGIEIERIDEDVIRVYNSDNTIGLRILALDADEINSFITSINTTDWSTLGGGLYYNDIKHMNNTNDIPMQFYDKINYSNVIPDSIERTDSNTIRVYTRNTMPLRALMVA